MSVAGAAEIERTKALLTERRAWLKFAIDAFAVASKQGLEADDILTCIKAVADASLAAEALHSVAKECDEKLHEWRNSVMIETGCPAVETAQGKWKLKKKPASAIITGAVPDTYMRTPPAQPDRALVLADLKAGRKLPWATLSNGGYTVEFTAHKAK